MPTTKPKPTPVPAERPPDPRVRFAPVLAWVITIVWVASSVADIFLDEWAPSPWLHLGMTFVAGWAFGPSVIGRIRGD